MNAIAKTNTATEVNDYETVNQVGIGVIGVLGTLVGTWGLACFMGGILQYGVIDFVKGWISAVTGI